MSQTYSPERRAQLTERGTRRLHLNTGEVWRVKIQGEPLTIIREKDLAERLIHVVYWLGDSWGKPKSRASAVSR